MYLVMAPRPTASATCAQTVFTEYAKKDSDIVRAKGARPVFFMSWAYADKPEMTAQLAEAYTVAGNANDAFVIPAGLAFARAVASISNTVSASFGFSTALMRSRMMLLKVLGLMSCARTSLPRKAAMPPADAIYGLAAKYLRKSRRATAPSARAPICDRDFDTVGRCG